MTTQEAVRIVHLSSLHGAIGVMLDCILSASSPLDRSESELERDRWDAVQATRHAMWAAAEVLADESAVWTAQHKRRKGDAK